MPTPFWIAYEVVRERHRELLASAGWRLPRQTSTAMVSAMLPTAGRVGRRKAGDVIMQRGRR